MGFRKACGQEATEFVLICILVFFSAMLVVFMFGNKIGKFFTSQSSAVLASKKTSSMLATSIQPKYNESIENYNGPTQNPATQATIVTLGGQQVTENADGSLSFVASGQSVALSAQMKDLANSVFQTTGSNGASELIKEIAYMIEQHKAEYPNGNVPIEVSYGDGERVGAATYTGSATAEANSFAVTVGTHTVIVQKDQACTPNAGYYCAFTGQYRVEGTSSGNSFSGNVTSTDTTLNHPGGTFTSNIDLSQGIDISSATFNQKDDLGSRTYTWNFDFTKTANQFSI